MISAKQARDLSYESLEMILSTLEIKIIDAAKQNKTKTKIELCDIISTDYKEDIITNIIQCLERNGYISKVIDCGKYNWSERYLLIDWS
jgi:hypothetical protein